jgi:hypothetical protein
MKKWLQNIAFLVLGIVLWSALSWGWERHRLAILYAPVAPRHGQPDVRAIARRGKSIVPDLCMAIAEEWSAYPDVTTSHMIGWNDALRNIGDQRAVPTLIALTDHKSPAVRWQVVLALSAFRSPLSLPAMNRMLKDTDPDVAKAARNMMWQAPSSSNSGIDKHARPGPSHGEGGREQ